LKAQSEGEDVKAGNCSLFLLWYRGGTRHCFHSETFEQ